MDETKASDLTLIFGETMDELDRPNLTEQELFEFLYYDEELPVTRRAVHYAVLNREIQPTRLGNGNFFSKRDGLDWIKSRRQAGVYRVPKVEPAQ